MSCKIKSLLLFVVFSLCSLGQTQANFIVNDLYADQNDPTVFWQFVGQFDLAEGPDFLDVPIAYNGIEAAELIFGSLEYGEYALSTNVDDLLVNHTAFYDSFESIEGIFEGAEDLIADADANPNADLDANPNADISFGYDAFGDISAFVRDRAFDGQFINYVFTSVKVSEPPFIAFLLLITLLSYRKFVKIKNK